MISVYLLLDCIFTPLPEDFPLHPALSERVPPCPVFAPRSIQLCLRGFHPTLPEGISTRSAKTIIFRYCPIRQKSVLLQP